MPQPIQCTATQLTLTMSSSLTLDWCAAKGKLAVRGLLAIEPGTGQGSVLEHRGLGYSGTMYPVTAVASTMRPGQARPAAPNIVSASSGLAPTCSRSVWLYPTSLRVGVGLSKSRVILPPAFRYSLTASRTCVSLTLCL